MQICLSEKEKSNWLAGDPMREGPANPSSVKAERQGRWLIPACSANYLTFPYILNAFDVLPEG
jgi:hypothetical protein